MSDDHMPASEQALAAVRRLHERVDRAAAALARTHAARLSCRRGCHGCCVDHLTVFEVEAARIRAENPAVLTGAPHPPGACAFLDAEGACRIYDSRPYVCRTQGLPLRWLDDDDDDGTTVEYRDICELNEPGPLLTDLSPAACWTLGPYEAELRAIQHGADPELPRTPLRHLFEPPAGG